jgi:hypothetical protein
VPGKSSHSNSLVYYYIAFLCLCLTLVASLSGSSESDGHMSTDNNHMITSSAVSSPMTLDGGLGGELPADSLLPPDIDEGPSFEYEDRSSSGYDMPAADARGQNDDESSSPSDISSSSGYDRPAADARRQNDDDSSSTSDGRSNRDQDVAISNTDDMPTDDYQTGDEATLPSQARDEQKMLETMVPLFPFVASNERGTEGTSTAYTVKVDADSFVIKAKSLCELTLALCHDESVCHFETQTVRTRNNNRSRLAVKAEPGNDFCFRTSGKRVASPALHRFQNIEIGRVKVVSEDAVPVTFHIHMYIVADLLNKTNYFTNTQLAVVNAAFNFVRMFPFHYLFEDLFEDIETDVLESYRNKLWMVHRFESSSGNVSKRAKSTFPDLRGVYGQFFLNSVEIMMGCLSDLDFSLDDFDDFKDFFEVHYLTGFSTPDNSVGVPFLQIQNAARAMIPNCVYVAQAVGIKEAWYTSPRATGELHKCDILLQQIDAGMLCIHSGIQKMVKPGTFASEALSIFVDYGVRIYPQDQSKALLLLGRPAARFAEQAMAAKRTGKHRNSGIRQRECSVFRILPTEKPRTKSRICYPEQISRCETLFPSTATISTVPVRVRVPVPRVPVPVLVPITVPVRQGTTVWYDQLEEARLPYESGGSSEAFEGHAPDLDNIAAESEAGSVDSSTGSPIDDDASDDHSSEVPEGSDPDYDGLDDSFHQDRSEDFSNESGSEYEYDNRSNGDASFDAEDLGEDSEEIEGSLAAVSSTHLKNIFWHYGCMVFGNYHGGTIEMQRVVSSQEGVWCGDIVASPAANQDCCIDNLQIYMPHLRIMEGKQNRESDDLRDLPAHMAVLLTPPLFEGMDTALRNKSAKKVVEMVTALGEICFSSFRDAGAFYSPFLLNRDDNWSVKNMHGNHIRIETFHQFHGGDVRPPQFPRTEVRISDMVVVADSFEVQDYWFESLTRMFHPLQGAFLSGLTVAFISSLPQNVRTSLLYCAEALLQFLDLTPFPGRIMKSIKNEVPPNEPWQMPVRYRVPLPTEEMEYMLHMSFGVKYAAFPTVYEPPCVSLADTDRLDRRVPLCFPPGYIHLIKKSINLPIQYLQNMANLRQILARYGVLGTLRGEEREEYSHRTDLLDVGPMSDINMEAFMDLERDEVTRMLTEAVGCTILMHSEEWFVGLCRDKTPRSEKDYTHVSSEIRAGMPASVLPRNNGMLPGMFPMNETAMDAFLVEEPHLTNVFKIATKKSTGSNSIYIENQSKLPANIDHTA